MICPECGTELDKGARVCSSCGKQLEETPPRNGRDFAIFSLVLGILSLFIFPYLYGPFAIVASLISKKQGGWKRTSTAGLILGIIAVVGYVATLILYHSIGIY